MTWQNEMSIILRHLVNDLDSSSYTFSDDRIEETILVASQLVLHEADFENTYTVDVDASSLSPDPTSASNKDDAFISLICLKSAYILLGSELKTHSLNAISLKDGPSALDLRGIVQGLNILFTDIAKRYDEAKIQYQLGGSIAGQAVLSPYSPGSDGVSGSARSGRFE
jgi:hypothetical protein